MIGLSDYKPPVLLQLILKYFIRNRRRTFRAVAILGIGIALVLSTDMLMSGFISQVDQFASLIDTDNEVITIIPENNEFEALESMISDIEAIGLDDYIVLNQKIQPIELTQRTLSVLITQTNLSRLVDWGWIDANLSKSSDQLFINPYSDLPQISSEYTTDYLNGSELTTYTPIDEISSDILLDNSYKEKIVSLDPNQIFIRIDNRRSRAELEQSMQSYDVEVISEPPSNAFLQITASQITGILILLQIAMSFLLVLSISYVMITLVMESADDLRILHMLGLDRSSIYLLFLGQSILASIIASALATICSILLLYALLPLLTLGNLPYGIIVINPGFILITALQSLLVGILAGLYPAKLGVDMYG